MNLKELKENKATELAAIAKDLRVEGAAGMRKQDLIFAILNASAEKNQAIFGPDDTSDLVNFLVSGAVKVTCPTPQGPVCIQLVRPGQLV